MVPALAAGFLLLAILGSKLLHRHPNAKPSSAVESSKQQAEPQPRAEAGPSAQVTRDRGKEQALNIPPPSNTPPVAAKNSSVKNAVATSSAGDPSHGAVVQQVLPDVSRSALRTIHGKLKVRVKVAVDSSGSVVVVKFDSRGPSKYFADRALQAARRWAFRPPEVDGQGVPSEWMLKFEFARTGTNVQPAQTSP
jgi:TonB family protein